MHLGLESRQADGQLGGGLLVARRLKRSWQETLKHLKTVHVAARSKFLPDLTQCILQNGQGPFAIENPGVGRRFRRDSFLSRRKSDVGSSTDSFESLTPVAFVAQKSAQHPEQKRPELPTQAVGLMQGRVLQHVQ